LPAELFTKPSLSTHFSTFCELVMVRRNWLWMLGAALVLMTAALIQGCGLKADPAPRRIQPLKSVTDVRLQEEAGGIFIRWRIPESSRPMTRFQIIRSEFGTQGQSCPGCPPGEVRIADLTSGEAKLVKVEANVFGYRDADVRPGRLYRYRVIGCDRTGACSEASAPVELSVTSQADSR